jgi:hypothetical protein
MITKPLIWSTILEFHEIGVLATACDVETSSDIPVEVDTLVHRSRTESFISNGESILRKGKHMRQEYVKSTDIIKQWNFSVTNLGP